MMQIGEEEEEEEEEEEVEDFCTVKNMEVRCKGAHPICGALNRRRLNSIKLAYDARRPDGRPH